MGQQLWPLADDQLQVDSTELESQLPRPSLRDRILARPVLLLYFFSRLLTLWISWRRLHQTRNPAVYNLTPPTASLSIPLFAVDVETMRLYSLRSQVNLFFYITLCIFSGHQNFPNTAIFPRLAMVGVDRWEFFSWFNDEHASTAHRSTFHAASRLGGLAARNLSNETEDVFIVHLSVLCL